VNRTDPQQLVQDGLQAAILARDVAKLSKPLIENLRAAGAEIEFPELRLKCPQGKMEYTAGLRLKDKLFVAGKVKLKIPIPEKVRLYSLSPYMALDEIVRIVPDGVEIDRRRLKNLGENYRIELEYSFEKQAAIDSLVFSTSPAETLATPDESDVQRYWLHSELKTVEFLKKLYSHVRVEDLDVKVDVTLRDDIKSVISSDLRFEIGMMAKLGSRDRNEQARALTYRQRHRMPKFRGNVLEVMQATQELFQPSKFPRFLNLEGPYRLGKCVRGTDLPDLFLPIYLPQSMLVYSSTDLTLDEPAKDGKLIYRKSDFVKKLTKIMEG